jgi:hypothetical protein
VTDQGARCHAARGLLLRACGLQCAVSTATESGVGQEHVCQRASGHGESASVTGQNRCSAEAFWGVPRAAVSRCNKVGREYTSYSITSLTRSPLQRAVRAMVESQPERLCALEVDHEFVPGWCPHRQLCRLRAPEDAIHVAGRATELIEIVRTVGDQAALGNVVTCDVDRGKPALSASGSRRHGAGMRNMSQTLPAYPQEGDKFTRMVGEPCYASSPPLCSVRSFVRRAGQRQLQDDQAAKSDYRYHCGARSR